MQQLERLERKIDALTRVVNQAKKPMWVKAGVITSLTGWNKSKMNQARENGYVKYKTEKDKEGKQSYFYDLNSLNEKFIR